MAAARPCAGRRLVLRAVVQIGRALSVIIGHRLQIDRHLKQSRLAVREACQLDADRRLIGRAQAGRDRDDGKAGVIPDSRHVLRPCFVGDLDVRPPQVVLGCWVGTAAYASSRAATETFTMVAAIELAPYEILVNCISPGLIDTQPKPLPPVMAERLGSRIPNLPLARPGDPDEVAGLALWLCSSGSTYVTGSVLHVDGGSGVGSRPDAPVIDDDVRYDWVTGQQRT